MNHKDEETQQSPDAKPRKKTHSVVLYLAILFASAFLLLLMSYLMQQRSNEVALTGLKESISSMQSLENLLEENSTLHKKVSALDEKNDTLTAENNTLRVELVQANAELAAARHLLDSVDVTP